MDKKEYIIRQLARTKSKKYEQYVVSRIVHLLNDNDIKFVTQQYISRPSGCALTDLFFPQVQLHVEVDEGYHKGNIDNDMVREADIVNATNHEIARVDATKSIEEINEDIDEIVVKIRMRVERLKAANSFIPWDIEQEFCSETYVKMGYIDTKDSVAFRTIKDACNCFGHNYLGYQRAGASHPDKDTQLWFPKLYPNGEWNNQISGDENTITERNEDENKAREHIKAHVERSNDENHRRIVFARVQGNLGDILYRFKGLYELCLNNSNPEAGLVWKRLTTRVVTFPHESC